MFEFFFVIGFFVMLMVTGVSLLGIVAALMVATIFMMFGGLFIMVINLLPWLILVVVIVWIWRAIKNKKRFSALK